MKFFPLIPLTLLLFFSGCDTPKSNTSSLGSSVLRVISTIQYPDIHRPWLKRQSFTRVGIATVIDGGRLLVTADMVAHSTYIGLEKPADGPKGSAVIEAIDEECNLAILKPLDSSIMKGMHPLSLDTTVRTGGHLKILQLESNGAVALSPATVTTITVMPYPYYDNSAYLTYRASTTIPQREGSFVIPALHNGKLAGLVMRYDPRTQSADIIPAPLIKRFLKESAKSSYMGLARAGLTWEGVKSTTLRTWLGVPENQAGVYVTSITHDGPAEKAGLKKGDFLLKIKGKPIDSEGNYLDPIYGNIPFNNLASLESSPGDPMEITYFRSTGEGTGTLGSTTITLQGHNPSSELSPSRLSSESIPYVFLGPLLFQELSRPYLREWGNNWRTEAPQNLVYLDAFQDEFPHDRKHWVVLSAVFPTSDTIGLHDLDGHVVKSLNGKPIRELADLSEAARHPENGFQKILLDGSEGPIWLDASTLAQQEAQVRRQYGIPAIPSH